MCHNEEFQDLNITFSNEVTRSADLINSFPSFLQPLIGYLFTNLQHHKKHMAELLGPLIGERRSMMSNADADKPDDYLMWIMEAAPKENSSTVEFAHKILHLNFASIHSTTVGATHALLYLAACPQYIPILREEAGTCIQEHGWTREGISKMRKIDSFMLEVARLSPNMLTGIHRKALKEHTFKDGTVVSKGTYIAAPVSSVHLDPSLYKNPDVFDGLRFYEEERGANTFSHAVPNPGYLFFGYGSHSCPGRFFASNILKALLAHVVLNYDIKLTQADRPANIYFGAFNRPDPSAKMLFRKRRT